MTTAQQLDLGVIQTQDKFVSAGVVDGYINALGRWLAWHMSSDDTPDLVCLSDTYRHLAPGQFRGELKRRLTVIGTPGDDAWPFHPDADIVKLLLRYMQSLKVKGKGASASSLQGYRSATAWLFKKFKRPVPDHFEGEAGRFQCGSKRDAAQAGARGATMCTDDKGKAILFPALLRILATIFAAIATIEGVFAWAFQTWLWNLMCRPGQLGFIHLNHIYWEVDAQYTIFTNQKNDPLGERAQPRAIYSNPVEPALSAPLALAVYCASTGWLAGPEHTSTGAVFPKGSDARFLKILDRVVESDRVKAVLMEEGVAPDKVKGHSARKGARTYAETDAPAGAAKDRGGWKKEGVDGVYSKFSKINDQRVGRLLTMIPLHYPRIAILPPHWAADAAADADWVKARDRAFPPAALDRLVSTAMRAHGWQAAQARTAGYRVVEKAPGGLGGGAAACSAGAGGLGSAAAGGGVAEGLGSGVAEGLGDGVAAGAGSAATGPKGAGGAAAVPVGRDLVMEAMTEISARVRLRKVFSMLLAQLVHHREWLLRLQSSHPLFTNAIFADAAVAAALSRHLIPPQLYKSANVTMQPTGVMLLPEVLARLQCMEDKMDRSAADVAKKVVEGVHEELRATGTQAGAITEEVMEGMLRRTMEAMGHRAGGAGASAPAAQGLPLGDIRKYRWEVDGRWRAVPEAYRLPSDGGFEGVFMDWFVANAARGTPPLRVLSPDDLGPWVRHGHDAPEDRGKCARCEWQRSRKDYSLLKTTMAAVETDYVAPGQRSAGLRLEEATAAWATVRATLEETLTEVGAKRVGELSWRTIALKYWKRRSAEVPPGGTHRCSAAGSAPRVVAPAKKRLREDVTGVGRPAKARDFRQQVPAVQQVVYEGLGGGGI